MPRKRNEILLPTLALAVIAASFAGNGIYVLLDSTDQAAGYDHDHYNALLSLYDKVRGASDSHGFAFHGTSGAIFYGASLIPVGLFGLNNLSLAAVPLLGFLLLIFFGYKLAKELAGGASDAGWAGAAFLSLTPFIFGLSRLYDPQTLVIASFLATAYFIARFQSSPSPKRMLPVALGFLVGLAVPHDTTTQLLFAFFPLVLLGLVILDLLFQKKIAPGAAAACVGVLLAAFAASACLRSSEWRNIFLNHYYAGEAGSFKQVHGFATTLPGYFLDAWFKTLLPIGAVVFAGLTIAAFAFDASRRTRPWAAALLLAIGLMSLIPKKNTWYVFEELSLLPILAAAGLHALRPKLTKNALAVLGSACAAALLAQYVYCFFAFEEPSSQALHDSMQSVRPIGLRLDRNDSESYRSRTAAFTSRFDEFFPEKDRVRLGILVDYRLGYGVVPYLLRSSGLSIDVFPAGLSDVPELGHGLDAILYAPPPGMTSSLDETLSDNKTFFKEYFADLGLRLSGSAESKNVMDFEAASRRMSEWRLSEKTDLGNGLWLLKSNHSHVLEN